MTSLLHRRNFVWQVVLLILVVVVALVSDPKGAMSKTEYVTFWSGDLRIFAQKHNTEVLLIDVDTGVPISMSDSRIDTANFSTNPFVLVSPGNSFEGIGGLGGVNDEIRLRIVASDAQNSGDPKPVIVWTGSLANSARHPSAPPGTDNSWMSYIPALDESGTLNGKELGRIFLGFTTREMYIIARRAEDPTNILVEDLITNTDFDEDDTITLTASSPNKVYEDSEIQAFFLDEFEDDTVNITGNVDTTVLVGCASKSGPDWTITPPSYANGDDGIELGTLFYTFVKRSLTVFPTQDDTTVTITDLSDGDDSIVVTLLNGDSDGDYDLYTPILDTNNGNQIVPRSSFPTVNIFTNNGNAFDDDFVKVESDKPVLVYVGPIGSDVREFADVAFSVPTGPDSRIIYAYAQNSGGSNDLQIFAFDSTTEVTITSLSQTDGFQGDAMHDFTIGPGIGGPNGWRKGTGTSDVWWGSDVWNGEMLRIESTHPITVINGDYDRPSFGAFAPFVLATPTLPPIANAGPDQSAFQGDTISFDATQSFDQDTILGSGTVRYEWDFDVAFDSDGDGDPANDVDASGPTPSRQYLVAGLFTARLLYTDDDGESDTDFIDIFVTGAICGNGTVETGESCDDGNILNGDCCDSNCQYEPAGTACLDSDFCNGDETCDGSGTCQPGTSVDCSDGVGCTDDYCDEVNNTCVNTPNNANCPDDGLYCNGEEVCDPVQECISTGDPCPAGTLCDDEEDTCKPAGLELYVPIDIKPGSWPNPFRLPADIDELRRRAKLSVAILGTEDFDVTTVDPMTIRITREGIDAEVAPLGYSYEDVATPFQGELCGGHDLNGDGYLDLQLKFRRKRLAKILGLYEAAGETIPLTVSGKLYEEFSGTPIRGQDCVRIKVRKAK